MSERFIVFGAGGHAKVIVESLRAARRGCEIALLDDDPAAGSRTVLGLPIIGTREWLSVNWLDAPVVPAIGRNALRAEFLHWLAGTGRAPATVVDPGARLSPSASVLPGSFIAPAATVNAETVLAEGSIVNTGATVDHDCRIGRAAHIAPGAHLCGGVEVGEETLVGAGAVVIPGIRIGRAAVVGAGAAVTRDVADGARVGGVPARPLSR
jgi:UDP-perosamine 4-acetyltransferase